MNSVIENHKKATEWLHKNSLRKAQCCWTCTYRRFMVIPKYGDTQDVCTLLKEELGLPVEACEICSPEDSVCDKWEG